MRQIREDPGQLLATYMTSESIKVTKARLGGPTSLPAALLVPPFSRERLKKVHAVVVGGRRGLAGVSLTSPLKEGVGGTQCKTAPQLCNSGGKTGEVSQENRI